MRLWSIHPRCLDTKGLVALWREALLARKVLQGKTRGYKHHPQLIRFKRASATISAINQYLESIFCESVRRGHAFDKSKLGKVYRNQKIKVSKGQIEYEAKLLKSKVRLRSPRELYRIKAIPNQMFKVVSGPVENWEKQIKGLKRL